MPVNFSLSKAITFSYQRLTISRLEQQKCWVHRQGRIQQSIWGGGGQILAEGPNLPPFSSFSTDLGHFILKKLLNLDIYFIFFVKSLSLFSRLGGNRPV